MPLLSGCGTLSYLLQAGRGQLALFNRAKPIPEVLKDPRTSDRVKKLLAEIPSVKAYGEKHGLKPTKNYQSYVKLNRSAAVYVVSASEPLNFKSKIWSFPIVGKFPYLGWFHLNAAKDYARKLAKKGWDADVRGAAAYSTLGWFTDPVLSTMIPKGDASRGELVNVVLHESVHATVYINGQAYFNESLADFVADHMTPQYLEAVSGKNSPDLRAYLKEEQEEDAAEKLLHEAYLKLDQVYKSTESKDQKLAQKQSILTALRKTLGWKKQINNATLIQFKTYNTGMPEFHAVYLACGEDWMRFMAMMKTIRGKDFSKPQQENLAPVLLPLAAKCREQGAKAAAPQ